jgi:hypothetical protein
MKTFKLAQCLACRVVDAGSADDFVELALAPEPVVGSVMAGRVAKVDRTTVSVQLAPHRYGRAFVFALSDSLLADATKVRVRASGWQR